MRWVLQMPRHGKPSGWGLQQGEKEPLLLCGAEVGEMNEAKKCSGYGVQRNVAERMRVENEPTASTWQ